MTYFNSHRPRWATATPRRGREGRTGFPAQLRPEYRRLPDPGPCDLAARVPAQSRDADTPVHDARSTGLSGTWRRSLRVSRLTRIRPHGDSTLPTVPKAVVRDIGPHRWFGQSDAPDDCAWVTWPGERAAVSCFFPDPEASLQPEAASPRERHVEVPADPDTHVYRITVASGAPASRGVTEEAIEYGDTGFTEPGADDHQLTVGIHHPDDRFGPGAIWMGV